MCVALPGKVISTNGNEAVVDFNGNTVSVRTGYTDVKTGDYVLVHAGLVLQKVNAQEAEDLNDLMTKVQAFS